MRIIVITILQTISVITMAQQVASNPFRNDGNGRPLCLRVNYRIEGSPYKTGAPVYQVLSDGNVKLLRKINVTYRDEKKYCEAVITRIFDWREQLYVLLSAGEIKKLYKGRHFLAAIFNDKKTK